MNIKTKSKNKKVINATPNEYDGIKFRSKLETYVYKQLKANNINADYEPITFELVPAFSFFGKKYRSITLTPDFVGDDFIIEAKGYPNDAFPMKWKMFLFHLLQLGMENKYKLFIVHSEKETRQCIEEILKLRES